MKKLYRKGVVHPTPPVVSDHLLYLLPAAILTLTSALSLEDKEMLAYLISCSSANHRKTTQKTSSAGGADHPACFDCYCFRCYMSYWARWDSSPNRQLIHEIIDDFEDTLLKESEKQRNKKERNKLKGKISKGKVSLGLDTESKSSELSLTQQVTESNSHAVVGVEAVEVEVEDSLEEEELEKGSVGRLMSFLGERFWSVWG